MEISSSTTVSSQSWFSRIKSSFKGLIAGIIIFLISFVLLFWNENRAVTTEQSLKEGAAAVVSVASDVVVPENQGKLVHLVGKADTPEILQDPTFGIRLNAIKLSRKVEMYQWDETKEEKTEKKIGGGTETKTTYHYTKVWSSKYIDASKFHEKGRHNPSMIYSSAQMMAKSVSLGGFVLSESLIHQIEDYKAIPVTQERWNQIPVNVQNICKLKDGELYIGQSIVSPEIGDYRIAFAAVEPLTVSVIAQQIGNSFGPYSTKAGKTIEILVYGTHSAESMFQAALQQNAMLTWLLRLVGFLVMLLGLFLIFNPLVVIADVLPFLGNLLGAGVGITAFLLAAAFSCLTIAVAWLFYRPVLGIILIGVAVAIILELRRHRKSRVAEKASATSQTDVQKDSK